MNYILNKNISDNILKNYGYRNNGIDYTYKIVAYYNKMGKRKQPIIFIRFLVNIKDNIFNYEVIDNDGSVYHHFYNRTFIKNRIVDIINKLLNKELNKMEESEIIEMIDNTKKNKNIINIKKLDNNAKLPTYNTNGAAGADLYACINNGDKILIKSNETAFIHTGLAIEIPKNYVGLVFARSGLSCKEGLAPANKVGVIDSDYRGELMVVLHNHSKAAKIVENGDRIAQLIIQPIEQYYFNVVDELEESLRGDGGFGSTGK